MLLPFRLRGANARFVHPLDPPPRTAILVPGFQSSRLVRVFPDWQASSIEKFAPAAIAGTFSQLTNLAEAVARVTHAVIPLAWDPAALLSAEDREFLWNCFGVPIFEQYLGPGNILLASECQAHCSLHVTPAYVGPVVLGPCACGSKVARLPQDWSGVGLRAVVKREYALTG